ncbi:MAG: hypothetical protein NE334_11815 [Lentisphaeraceae bacterium]|nr:hypothetical protein [Lentisphaeraceae bacterium]
MSVSREPLVVVKANYKNKESKKALFAEVRDIVREIEEADSSYGPLTDEKIANVIFSGFNSKFDEFTLLFTPNFETKKA